LNSGAYECGAIRDSVPPEEALQVLSDAWLGDTEARSDFFVGAAVTDQLEDAPLAWRQPVRRH